MLATVTENMPMLEPKSVNDDKHQARLFTIVYRETWRWGTWAWRGGGWWGRPPPSTRPSGCWRRCTRPRTPAWCRSSPAAAARTLRAAAWPQHRNLWCSPRDLQSSSVLVKAQISTHSGELTIYVGKYVVFINKWQFLFSANRSNPYIIIKWLDNIDIHLRHFKSQIQHFCACQIINNHHHCDRYYKKYKNLFCLLHRYTFYNIL